MALWRVIACTSVSLGVWLITGCTVHVYQYPAGASSVAWQASGEMRSVSQRSVSPESGMSAPTQPLPVFAPAAPLAVPAPMQPLIVSAPVVLAPPSPKTRESWPLVERTPPGRKPSRWLLSSAPPAPDRQVNSSLPPTQPTPSTLEPAGRAWRLANPAPRLAATLANNHNAPLPPESDQTAHGPIPFKQTLLCPVGFQPPCPGSLLKPSPVRNGQ